MAKCQCPEVADASSGDEAESLLKEAKAQVPTSHIRGCEPLLCRRVCGVSVMELVMQNGWAYQARYEF